MIERPAPLRKVDSGPIWASPEVVGPLCHAVPFVLGILAILGVFIWVLCQPVPHQPPPPEVEVSSPQ